MIFSSLSVFCQFVSPEEARLVAKNAYTERLNATGLKTNFTLNDDFISFPSKDNVTLYIFEPAESEGYVIISAEKSMYPLLAYSFESNLKRSSTPPAFWFLIEAYSSQINYIKANKIAASDKINGEWNHYLNKSFNKSGLNIQNQAPLLTTRWNQDCFYNELCPADPAGPCGFVYAGCVATAMGQIMKFHNWPPQGAGSVHYMHHTFGSHNVNFANATYNWSIMPNVLTSSNLEVAKLLYHCGVSVRMDYSPHGSGASSQSASIALRNNFRYAPYLSHIEKTGFDNATWADMLKVDILAKRPVYYVGFSGSGGHAFIADGFQNNHFHFDFGWGGSANGYFNLNDVGGFNSGQAATFSIEPNYTGPQYCNSKTVLNQASGSFSDGSAANVRYANLSSCKWLIQVPDAEAIVLNFTRLNTEEGIDRIIIYEGTSENGRKLADISGYNIPNTPIVASGNSMFVWFITDELNASFGWDANYTSWLTNVDENTKPKIKISPNPADKLISVELPNSFTVNSTFNIYDLYGKKVKSGIVNQNYNSFTVETNTLPNGIYSIRFVNGLGISLNEKFLISR